MALAAARLGGIAKNNTKIRAILLYKRVQVNDEQAPCDEVGSRRDAFCPPKSGVRESKMRQAMFRFLHMIDAVRAVHNALSSVYGFTTVYSSCCLTNIRLIYLIT